MRIPKHLVAASSIVALLFLLTHTWISWHALRSSGIAGGLATLFLPVVAELYWGIHEWRTSGLLSTPSIVAWVGALAGISTYPLQSALTRSMTTTLETAQDGSAEEIEQRDLLTAVGSQMSATLDLTPEWIGRLRQLRLGWNGIEVGAPRAHATNPFGRGEFWQRLQAVTGTPNRNDAAAQWLRFGEAWRSFVERAKLAPGRYETRIWRDGEGDVLVAVEVTADLMLLAQALASGIRWEEEDGGIPGPSCDPKRPYGDFTNYPIDMALSLGWNERIDRSADTWELSPRDDEALERIHYQDVLPTMQAILQHARLP